jgi:hypothetical protein
VTTSDWKASPADIHRFVGVVNRREVDGTLELFAEDALLTGGPRFTEPIVGRTAIREMFTFYFQAFVEMRFVPTESFADRNELVTLMDLTATLSPGTTGSAFGSPTGGHRRVSWRGAYRFVFNPQGKIALLAIYGDESTGRWFRPTGTGTGVVSRTP